MIDFVETSQKFAQLLEEQVPVKYFGEKPPKVESETASKIGKYVIITSL